MIKRGDLYYADLSPVVGSEQGGVRPVLVVQNDIGNKYSPTIIAAAITSGACAQVLEWGLRRERGIGLNSAEIGNILIRGCERDQDRVYPNTQWGYGRLNVYNAFRNL